jgi:hypothetical protein
VTILASCSAVTSAEYVMTAAVQQQLAQAVRRCPCTIGFKDAVGASQRAAGNIAFTFGRQNGTKQKQSINQNKGTSTHLLLQHSIVYTAISALVCASSTCSSSSSSSSAHL